MKIGAVRVNSAVAMAPMEEHTNYPLRVLAKQFGAGLVCSERVDAADVAARDRRALRLLYTQPDESPRAGQISGADPAVMAEAARVVEQQGFNIVDLNFECPIRRIAGRGEGGALMADPAAIGTIVAAVVRAVSIPVTIKIRTGPDADRETAPEVVCRAQEAGAAAVEIHARSVAQAYVGGPDWGAIGRAKQVAQVPVLGSGGIRLAADAVEMLRQTGADGAAIGRGCLGNPWIFRQAKALLAGGVAVSPPAVGERGRVLLQLVEAEFHLYGATVALRRLARIACYFAKFLADQAPFREGLQRVRNFHQFRDLVRTHFR
jgi:tRNA-dihydrouridine synthase B